MNLDTEILEDMDRNNKINEQFFLEVLDTKDLPFIIYKNTYNGYPWGEWERVSEKIEKLADKYNFFDQASVLKVYNKSQVFNLFYFFTSYATNHKKEWASEILRLPWRTLNYLLEKRAVCQMLIEHIQRSEVHNELLQSYLCLLWATTKHKVLDVEEEKKLITYILKDTSPKSFIRKFIVKRLDKLNGLSKSSYTAPQSKKQSCAVIISGQFRFNSDINQLLYILTHQESFIITGVFIASWQKIGGINTTQKDKVYRYLDNEVIMKVKNGHLDINDVINKLDSYSSSVQISLSEDISDVSLHIKLNNEDEYPYNNMLNSEKMYFNNAYWVKTLGKEFFIDNFDFILKVRPDIEIKEINLDKCLDGRVYAEQGWMYRSWGFGMGDQVMFGSSKYIANLLTVHSEKDISRLVSILYPYSEGYMGHVNLGIYAWLESFDVERFPAMKFNLKLPPKLNLYNLNLEGSL